MNYNRQQYFEEGNTMEATKHNTSASIYFIASIYQETYGSIESHLMAKWKSENDTMFGNPPVSSLILREFLPLLFKGF
jgi:hypothetical protein